MHDARMDMHVGLVGLLFIVAAMLSSIVAVAVFLLAIGALSIDWWDGPQMSARVTGVMFLVTALALTVWAVVTATVGARVRRRRGPVARLLALGVAVMHLFVLPFGTALGVYSLWVLLHPDTRALFEPTVETEA